MDAVTMCCDSDNDPPCIMESDKVKIFALNYIITNHPHSQGGMLFCGGKPFNCRNRLALLPGRIVTKSR